MTKKSDEAPGAGIRPALGTVAAVGALFTLGALVLFPTKTGLSVLAGALMATSNLYVLAKVVEALVTSEPEPEPEKNTATEGANAGSDEAEKKPREGSRGKPEVPSTFSGAWAAFGAVKMVVLFGSTWILMTRGLVDPMGLLVGYGSLPIGVAISGLAPALRPKRRR